MRQHAGGAAALAALTLACHPPPACATAVSGSQLRVLAERAANDPAALARLRGVDQVDGAPADLAGALAGVRGAALQERLAVLARPGVAPGDDAEATVRARAIVAERRFHRRAKRGPLDGVLHRLVRWFGRLGPSLPQGGLSLPLVLLALAALGLGAALASRLIRRRVRAGAAPPAAPGVPAVSASELERLAAAADTAGDHDVAVRLRFRAGLLRLGQDGTLGYRASLSSRDAARQLASPTFDELARDFDAVAYGDRAAGAEEAARSRDGWRELLAERGARR